MKHWWLSLLLPLLLLLLLLETISVATKEAADDEEITTTTTNTFRLVGVVGIDLSLTSSSFGPASLRTGLRRWTEADLWRLAAHQWRLLRRQKEKELGANTAAATAESDDEEEDEEEEVSRQELENVFPELRPLRGVKAVAKQTTVDATTTKTTTTKETKKEIVPDPSDLETVLRLAEMSWNAYEERGSDLWIDLPGWNVTLDFGFDSDNLQGHVFMSEDGSIVVMAIKGTTFKFFGDGGTSEKDRYMDNVMFSCCCARIDEDFETVCDCFRGDNDNNVCSQSCLEEHARTDPISYYAAAQEIFYAVSSMYPSSQIWFTGHSLGGGLAGVLAANQSLPAFTYESPGELLYAQRLGISLRDHSDYDIFHFGNTGDPIFMGTCRGRFSTCEMFGYAMETTCHIGHTCLWSADGLTNINNHRLSVVIEKFILNEPLPPCRAVYDCVDCAEWMFE